MIYTIEGKVSLLKENFIVLETGGIGFKIFLTDRNLRKLSVGQKAKLFCFFHFREEVQALYGFLTEEELKFFELLNSVQGVGPKIAMAILEINDLNDLRAAIKEDRPDLLSRASGVGQKTAERIILELRGKIKAPSSEMSVKKMETDADLTEALINLGYSRGEIKKAFEKIEKEITDPEKRLREALKILAKKS